jgi:hypothetical protein
MSNGEQSMRQCVVDRLETLRENLPAHIALDEWIGDGGEMPAFGTSDVHEAIESVACAWGYIQGAADAVNQTVLEMIGNLEITLQSFDVPAQSKRTKAVVAFLDSASKPFIVDDDPHRDCAVPCGLVGCEPRERAKAKRKPRPPARKGART